MQILRKTEEIIYPAASAHPTLHRLSETDQPFRHDMGGLYFYEQGPASSESLKSSLSKTLAIFYPLAGRLVERTESVSTCPGEGEGTCAHAIGAQEGRRRQADVDVSCLDQGALFCEAWTDTRLDAYQPDFQPHPDFDLLRVISAHHHTFLLQVQITYFSCGGICLCVQSYHALVDATANGHFMKCWAEIANGEGSPSVSPYMNHPPLEVVYMPKELHNSCIQVFSPYQQPFASIPTEEISNKIFHFKPELIESLKSETSHEGCKYSSFECIAAYMSRIITLARGTSCNEEVCISYVVDGRGRLEPPLPPSYFGNVVFQTHASVKVRDLVEKSLSHTTGLIREATAKISDAYMRSVIEWSTRQPSAMLNPTCLSQHIYFNSWTSFPLRDLNFGWGNLLCCRVRLIPGQLVLLFPSILGKGHVEVLVALNKDHMKSFESLLSQNPLY